MLSPVEIIKIVPIDKNIEVIHKETCPLCGKKLDASYESRGSDFECLNGCYLLSEIESVHRFMIFGYFVIVNDNFASEKKMREENFVRQLIAYYRENDRYLAEILDRG